ncbi:cell envelope integrity TolA C-terminal domain-containing protein [Buttiauxella gaviniae]|uniref:Cell envelope integrity TolA C-terminal domain-containing protein n=1 Tax=Buttiauxella gaviniae TaxID=82990 RepID=A0ABV3NWG5_9ENTR
MDFTKPPKSNGEVGHIPLKPAPSVPAYLFGVSVGKAIRAELPEAEQYQGKVCSMRLRFKPDGTLLNISAGGDPAYCQALKDATNRTALPKPVSGEMDRNGYIPVLDFKEVPLHVTTVGY